MKTVCVLWPWSKVKTGEGFFAPSLDTEATKKEGLSAALRSRVFNAKARVGIQQGLIGVWFYR
jgi:hypothetical protein